MDIQRVPCCHMFRRHSKGFIARPIVCGIGEDMSDVLTFWQEKERQMIVVRLLTRHAADKPLLSLPSRHHDVLADYTIENLCFVPHRWYHAQKVQARLSLVVHRVVRYAGQ